MVAHHDPRSHDPVRLGGIGGIVAAEIAERTGLETRTTVLGHIQRGGPPEPADRVLATRFGCRAIDLLLGGAENRLVVMNDGRIGDAPLLDAVNRQRLVPRDHPLIDVARSVRTCVGDE